MGKRASKLDLVAREKDIQDFMAKGKTRAETCRELGEKWRVSPRAIEKQYDNIVVELEKVVEAGRAELRAKLMIRNDEIYKRSMAEGQLKTALDANSAQAKLGGLLSDKKDVVAEPPKVITISERGNQGLNLVKASGTDE